MKDGLNKRRRLGVAVAVQLLLVGLLLSPSLVDGFGAREITLITAPVDPRDLLRGQYLTLRYGVNQVRAGADVQPGRAAYVPLREGAGGIWTGERATSERPSSGVFLKGQVEWTNQGRANLSYGIERFYLSEETAGSEAAQASGGLQARVSVAPSGRARLLQLWRGDERIR